ncbi:hypothetical protein [Paenibacillus montanisoli]|uniref:Spore coat protein n=1 Tax=Paenibacillus montanisoli TaxID=2081970 RepID=A0A328TUN3_9BACL|nr:hypothetical protein [Paenibacillus montanisoli]RAP74248.1 hypothetical protein DL346_24635 [Paenibacillus montanisoli]
MWKMTGWLAKTIAAGLLISFLSIWTTGYIVNSYVETLLKQFNVPLDEKPFALNGVWGGLWGVDPVVKEKGDANSGSANTENKESADKETDASGGKDAAANDTKSEGNGPEAVDAFGDLPSGELSDIGGGTGPKGNSGAVSSDDEVAMSTEELNAAKSQISDADKEQLFKEMSKLPQEAWQKISTLMEEGLTDSEMTQVQQLLAQHLDRAEYDKMLTILSKY